jgi:hypothetical protein
VTFLLIGFARREWKRRGGQEWTEFELKLVSRSEEASGHRPRYGTSFIKRRNCPVEICKVPSKCLSKCSSGGREPME